MSLDRTIQLGITSCMEETAPPFDVRFTGANGEELLRITFKEPSWRVVQDTAHRASALGPGPVADALWVCACISSWSLLAPVSPEAVLGLAVPIQRALPSIVTEILKLSEQLTKNSEPLSQPNTTQQSSETAAHLMTKEHSDGQAQS